ncbi:MAG: 7-carboxy-7-deazaguanine synthase QueE [Candidatus Poribacteria bacterium]|jgi:7-carboxy-7-deazaguanine synthase|nr:7-carboxy-7-deazaguanine synthase QueE [Candidatus Poribacteria bacterium]|tara:strand:- start:1081 stop:1761 length:681 start_codon:yes stop_codon:yes gene_type:complete
MKYSEIFYSIQGEGQLIGYPSVFFRTSYCNLRCIWCDTPYTSWEPEDKDISVEDAVDAILAHNCKQVVITGGEPFMQSKDLTILCRRLRQNGKHITIETNGTLFEKVEADLLSISPKLENSNPSEFNHHFKQHQRNRINQPVLRQFLDYYSCQLKFVVETERDLFEIHQLEREMQIPASIIVLMPQGITNNQIQEKQNWIVETCKKYGYRYSPRLHVDIWGDTRGT